MKYAIPFALATTLLAAAAAGQGITGEVLSGKLVKPEVGVYAWYELKDHSVNLQYNLRQAIIGKERVGRKTGYWLETQIIPQVGFSAVYKMLLTGPASDPKNVHRIIYKEGTAPPKEIPVNQESAPVAKKEPKRKSLGVEEFALPEGKVEAERFVILRDGESLKDVIPENPDGRTEIWVNEKVRPMGIVKLRTPQGELKLLRYGKGGPDAKSAIGEPAAPGAEGVEEAPRSALKVRVKTEEDNRSVQDKLNERRRR